jgi:hypothetical protein
MPALAPVDNPLDEETAVWVAIWDEEEVEDGAVAVAVVVADVEAAVVYRLRSVDSTSITMGTPHMVYVPEMLVLVV